MSKFCKTFVKFLQKFAKFDARRRLSISKNAEKCVFGRKNRRRYRRERALQSSLILFDFHTTQRFNFHMVFSPEGASTLEIIVGAVKDISGAEVHENVPLSMYAWLFIRPRGGSGRQAVWTATIARKDAFFSIFRDLQDLHSFEPLKSQDLQIFCNLKTAPNSKCQQYVVKRF